MRLSGWIEKLEGKSTRAVLDRASLHAPGSFTFSISGAWRPPSQGPPKKILPKVPGPVQMAEERRKK